MHRLLAPLLFCLLPFSAHAAEAGKTITLVADRWCPYNCAASASQPGFMVEITRAIFKKYDIAVTYKVLPWSSAIEQTRSGRYDAVVGASQGDVPDFIFPSLTQGMSSMQFWVKKDSNWSYNGISSLNEVRIGIIAGYSYSKILDMYLNLNRSQTERIQPVSGDNALELNLRKLEAGRIDVTPEDKNVMQYYFSSRGLPMTVKSAGTPVARENMEDIYLYVAFSPANPKSQQYAQAMTQGMQELRRSGELKAILERYRVEDWFPVTRK